MSVWEAGRAEFGEFGHLVDWMCELVIQDVGGGAGSKRSPPDTSYPSQVPQDHVETSASGPCRKDVLWVWSSVEVTLIIVIPGLDRESLSQNECEFLCFTLIILIFGEISVKPTILHLFLHAARLRERFRRLPFRALTRALWK